MGGVRLHAMLVGVRQVARKNKVAALWKSNRSRNGFVFFLQAINTILKFHLHAVFQECKTYV